MATFLSLMTVLCIGIVIVIVSKLIGNYLNM
jgi:hypothetical protein